MKQLAMKQPAMKTPVMKNPVMKNPVMKQTAAKHLGFTLLELLIAMVILTVLAGFALPTYQSYVETSQQGVLRTNIMTMSVFQEDFFLRNGTYANNLADIAAIETAIGWEPQSDDGTTYAIASSDGTFYQVTATNAEGMSVCLAMPDRTDCT